MAETKKRIVFFDLVKGIGVFLVLVGHLQGDAIFAYSPYILYLCRWIFSFHMPLFFIVSGMMICLRNDKDKEIRPLIAKRFRGIMIPYYWFSLIYIGIVLHALIIVKSIAPYTLYVNLWYVLGLYGMNVLWFLPALFLGEILFILIIKKCDDKKSALIIVMLTIMAYFLNLFLKKFNYDTEMLKRVQELYITLLRPFFACSFIAIGYYLFKLYNKLSKEFSIKEVILSFVFLIIGIVCCRFNNAVDFRSLVQSNVILYYIAGISGSLWLILLCKNLALIKSKKSPTGYCRFNIISFWGVNSLIIMACHNNSVILSWALKAAMYINQFLTHARGYICYALIVLIMAVYVHIVTYLINLFVPFIAGKSLKSSKVYSKLLKS